LNTWWIFFYFICHCWLCLIFE